MKWWKATGLALGALAAARAGLGAYGAARWHEASRALLASLEAARMPPEPAHYDPRELEGLPAPVRRYFRSALKEGQPIIAAVDVRQEGSMNLGHCREQWKPFSASQRVVTRRPGFVWDARVRVMPGLPVHVHDAYVGGAGILEPALLGLCNLGPIRGDGDVAQGELIRFLAEAAWYPTALLPSQGVHWLPIDERSARATLTDGPIGATLLFRFNAQGLIETVSAHARGRAVGKTVVMAPWEGRWSDYQEHDGMVVPLSGEAAWLLPGGRRPYWRGTATGLAYEMARPR